MHRALIALVLISACAVTQQVRTAVPVTDDSGSLVMRVPLRPYSMGRPDSGWQGRVVLAGSRIEVDFPAIAADNVGCGAVDTLRYPVRRYYWLATARDPGVRSPNNHFQQAALRFELPPDAVPTAMRLDSALTHTALKVEEAGGEPPMTVATARLAHGAQLIGATIGGLPGWRVRMVVDDARAVKAFLSAGADSISLSWCQRDQWLTHIIVPLERR